MNSMSSYRQASGIRGYTLIELLVVIAVIALLASILLPAISGAKKKALIKRARVEMEQIRGATQAYIGDYNGRMPVTPNAAGAGVPDFTHTDGTLITGQAYNSYNSNSVAILSDLVQFRGGAGTINAGHSRNPKQNKYLNGKESDGDSANPQPGIGLDGIYRDPWGRPYIITYDVNYDGVCHDALYKLDIVSGGGRVGTFQTGGPNTWGVRGEVLVWSAGPDGLYDPAIAANMGVNEDNILSWWDRK